MRYVVSYFFWAWDVLKIWMWPMFYNHPVLLYWSWWQWKRPVQIFCIQNCPVFHRFIAFNFAICLPRGERVGAQRVFVDEQAWSSLYMYSLVFICNFPDLLAKCNEIVVKAALGWWHWSLLIKPWPWCIVRRRVIWGHFLSSLSWRCWRGAVCFNFD